MAKHLKLNIKNAQIAEAINLGSLKDKLKKKAAAEATADEAAQKSKATKAKADKEKTPTEKGTEEAAPRIRARSKSAFAEGTPPKVEESASVEEVVEETAVTHTPEEPREEIFAEELQELAETTAAAEPEAPAPAEVVETKAPTEEVAPPQPIKAHKEEHKPAQPQPVQDKPVPPKPEYVKLGPTGRHMRDLAPKPRPAPVHVTPPPHQGHRQHHTPRPIGDRPAPARTVSEPPNPDKLKAKLNKQGPVKETDMGVNKVSAKAKEYRDIKPTKRVEPNRSFDARDRHGLRAGDEESTWRKRRQIKQAKQEEETIRPTAIKVRLPISLKDLAAEMKLKSSQLVAKLFLQGLVVTLNDLLDDETTIQLLGHEFGCEITIDTSEEERIRITDKTIKEEIKGSDPDQLIIRPPVVAFMGHVDHGKTSLIDAIRKSNRAAGEAGAITQHIGAFRCSTSVGDITILDTPGHEAFSAMRARGADVTDIVVLVVAGDEGMRQQTIEALQHAKAAGVTIVVAINKSDKPNYNPETVYRQLSEQELLPEAWGGQTITVRCSAVTGEGIQALLEMLAIQAEVLELKANPSSRARGSVLESEMHKGMGSVATVLVQNGTLRVGDALVFGQHWGRVKTMQNEFGKELETAPPSTPVEITGLSGLPEAGQEFIVVKSEREAREIAEVRMQGVRQTNQLMKKKMTLENLVQQASESPRKILNIIVRADVQGSLEALKVALQKIESTKAELVIIFAGVGEVSESDVQLAAASKALILGFHTQIESHAESFVRQLGVQVRMHDIIYHAVDDVKDILLGMLDKIAIETEKGKAEVRATFKSSHHGIIAGCYVTEGTITRTNHVRVMRNGVQVYRGPISSLKRVKDDVREVQKGFECGILMGSYNDFQPGDILEAYEITYIAQEL